MSGGLWIVSNEENSRLPYFRVVRGPGIDQALLGNLLGPLSYGNREGELAAGSLSSHDIQAPTVRLHYPLADSKV